MSIPFFKISVDNLTFVCVSHTCLHKELKLINYVVFHTVFEPSFAFPFHFSHFSSASMSKSVITACIIQW